MNSMVFVLPIKIDNNIRWVNLKAVLTYYTRLFPENKFIVVEDDKQQRVTSDLISISPNILHYFSRNRDLPHRKSKAMNIGVRLALAKYVCILDSDCIAGKTAIESCLQKLQEGYDFAFPHHSFWLKLKKHMRDEFIKQNYSWDFLMSIPTPEHLTMGESNDFCSIHPQFSAGVVLYNRQKYIEAGGFNEKFIGWGGEDDELVVRFRKLRLKEFRDMGDKNAKIFHLWHPQSSLVFRQHNIDEYEKICKMTRIELTSYVKSDFFYH